LIVIVVGVMLGTGWLARASIRDFLYQAQQPKLPVAEGYKVASSTPIRPPLAPPSQGGESKSLPNSVNLAVPFLLQAPTHNWSEPYQNACEEAAAIMVDAFYHGRKDRFHEQDGNKAILDLITFEKKLLGKYDDTTAEETAHLIRAYFHYKNVTVQEVTSTQALKPILAKGYPILVPASGKSLHNPYFRNGGPPYHMLVIKGYLADGRWIMNDPGIGLGPDYVYTDKVLWEAMHDWNGGDVLHGKKMIIVIIPNS